MNALGEEHDWWRHGLCKHVCQNNGGSFLPHNICQNLTNERKVRFGFGNLFVPIYFNDPCLLGPESSLQVPPVKPLSFCQ